MNEIEKAIKDLTDAAKPPPYTIEESTTKSFAKREFTKLNRKNIYPDPQLIYDLLIENNWKENQAKHLLKKLKKHFRSDELKLEFE